MRARAVVALLVSVVILGACGGGDTGPGEEPVRTTSVTLPKSYRFEPEAIAVAAGATVTWTNEDDFPHNVRLLDESDRIVDLPIGGEGTLTFDSPGTVEYECSIHPSQMRGSVTVE
jgi:plastocyanin